MKIIVVILTLFGACSGSSKQWQLDVNFNNPNNWDSGKTPCATNRIIFPATMNGVLLQTNISSVRELILPINGQILMPSDMILAFSDDNMADPLCDGGDVTFVRTDPESWFDPDNWQDLADMISVETERVPCQYDSIIFPEEKLFNVGLDSSVTIGRMSFSGKDYNTQRFASFIASGAGKIQFTPINSASVTVQGSACPITSGCACGNDNDVLLRKICNQYSCLATSCIDSVTPVGGCCGLCGAVLTMDYNPATFNMATFRNMVRDKYHVHDSQATTGREVNTGAVDSYTSKTSNNQIQMVLTDKAVGSSSGQTAINLAQQIMTDIQNDPGSYGVINVLMQSSKRGTGAQTGGLQGGAVAGIIIAIIVIVVIICTVGFLVIRQRSNFFFSKGQPLNADMVITPEITLDFMEEIPGQPPAMYMQSFDNPVYTAPAAQDNIYDDPTRVSGVDLTSDEPDDLKRGGKKSKKAKGLPPETMNQYDGISGFANPNYATMMETGIDDLQIVVENDGAKGFDVERQESES